jgi:hypothetical protein
MLYIIFLVISTVHSESGSCSLQGTNRLSSAILTYKPNKEYDDIHIEKLSTTELTEDINLIELQNPGVVCISGGVLCACPSQITDKYGKCCDTGYIDQCDICNGDGTSCRPDVLPGNRELVASACMLMITGIYMSILMIPPIFIIVPITFIYVNLYVYMNNIIYESYNSVLSTLIMYRILMIIYPLYWLWLIYKVYNKFIYVLFKHK